MTVQDLLNYTVRLMGDYANIADYGSESYPAVTSVVGELMRLRVGLQDSAYKYTVDSTFTPAYTTTVDDSIPIPLPTAITTADQIVFIGFSPLYEKEYYPELEEDSGAYYLLAPDDYYGEILVRYMASPTTFANSTDVIGISEDAATAVAAYGIAALLSLHHTPELVSFFEQKYIEAKTRWQKRSILRRTEVIDVYGITNNYS